jgi:aldose 1-epimerase
MDVVTLEVLSEQARFVPSFGAICVSYRVASLEVIAGPPSLDALSECPFEYGMPVLFPWPGRVAGARFEWRQREHSLPINDLRGHALHGLTYRANFQVVRRGPYFLECEFDSRSDPSISAVWPYDFILKIDYEIGGGLRMRISASNVGSEPMPFGFGLHPYFFAPPARRGTRQSTRIQMPAEKRWPLNAELIPGGPPISVDERFDLRAGRTLDNEHYDDAFCSLGADADGFSSARVVDSEFGIAVEVKGDASFRNWMFYAPTNRSLVSIEPYTCAPDAFNLAHAGIDAGARELLPGGTWEGSVAISLSAP